MNDFKVGDIIYWIDTEGYHVLTSLDDITIQWGEITNIDNGLYEYEIDKEFIIHMTTPSLFKSKNEAIDALIKHLESMRDEI